MRDYLDAIRSRVVVFDGGMGATLEQFDLSLERDYAASRARARGARAQPARRHRGRPRVDGRGRRRGLETDTFQACRLKLDEWGLGEHTLEINRKRRGDRPQGRRRGPLRRRARSARPATSPPPTTRRSARSRFRELVDVFAEQAAGPASRAASDLLIIETAQDILEVKAAIFGAREAFSQLGRAVPIQCSVSLLPNGGKMLLGTDIRRRADDARGAEGRRRSA